MFAMHVGPVRQLIRSRFDDGQSEIKVCCVSQCEGQNKNKNNNNNNKAFITWQNDHGSQAKRDRYKHLKKKQAQRKLREI